MLRIELNKRDYSQAILDIWMPITWDGSQIGSFCIGNVFVGSPVVGSPHAHHPRNDR